MGWAAAAGKAGERSTRPFGVYAYATAQVQRRWAAECVPDLVLIAMDPGRGWGMALGGSVVAGGGVAGWNQVLAMKMIKIQKETPLPRRFVSLPPKLKKNVFRKRERQQDGIPLLAAETTQVEAPSSTF